MCVSFVEHGFMSCSSAKNKGLINVNTLPSSFATEMEILCPSGTKMLYCEPFSAQGGALVGTHNYFDEIDTPEKAYILGLLYTDGCRCDRDMHYQIVLKLQDTDVDILYKMQECLQSNRPLKYIITEPKMFPNGKIYSPKNQYALIIDNKQIATSLEKWGIIPNKTYTLKFPDFLPEKLYP